MFRIEKTPDPNSPHVIQRNFICNGGVHKIEENIVEFKGAMPHEKILGSKITVVGGCDGKCARTLRHGWFSRMN